MPITPNALQLARLKKTARDAVSHPLVPTSARDAIAELVGMVDTLSGDVDWLRECIKLNGLRVPRTVPETVDETAAE